MESVFEINYYNIRVDDDRFGSRRLRILISETHYVIYYNKVSAEIITSEN